MRQHLLAPTPVSQWLSEWVIDSFRFGDSFCISELCELVWFIITRLTGAEVHWLLLILEEKQTVGNIAMSNPKEGNSKNWENSKLLNFCMYVGGKCWWMVVGKQACHIVPPWHLIQYKFAHLIPPRSPFILKPPTYFLSSDNKIRAYENKQSCKAER